MPKHYIAPFIECDIVLKYFSTNTHVRRRFQDSELKQFIPEIKEVTRILNQLKKDGFVDIDGHWNNMYTINGTAEIFAKNGGYKEDFERFNSQEQQDSIQKWYDTQNAKNVFDDYPMVSKKSTWALVISIIALLVEIAKLIIQK